MSICRPKVTTRMMSTPSRRIWFMQCPHVTAYGSFTDLVALAHGHVLSQQVQTALAAITGAEKP